MENLTNAILDLGKNNWLEYVQLFATVVSIIISGLAVYYAVNIPKKIADQQNKIALFEKRHNTYVKLADLFHAGIFMRVAIFMVVEKRKNEKSPILKSKPNGDYKADKALLLEASFLFNSSIGNKLKKISELRERFFKNEDLLEEGLSKFSDDDLFAYNDASFDLYEWKIDTTKILKEISNRNIFKSEIDIDSDLKYDVYSLEKEQYEIIKEINRLQDEVLEEIVEEMKIYYPL